MNLTLKVWRQKNSKAPGRFVEYQAKNIIPDMSFLEMLDVVNEDLINRGEEPMRSTRIVAKASAERVRCHQWRPPRRTQGHDGLPAPHAPLQDGDDCD